MGCSSSKNFTSRDFINSSAKKYCSSCNQQCTQRGWCQPCEAKRFKEDFHNWTSGNSELDQFIRHTQLNATAPQMFLEWIPYDKFERIKEIKKGGFGVVYKAMWDLGPKLYWDDSKKNWVREGEKQISLKRLYDSDKADSHFWKELFRHRCQSKFVPHCYGFSRDPATHEYIIVSDLIEGDLGHYLEKNSRSITWEKKLGIVYNIAHGLMTIHNAGLIHRDFHSGNILRHFNGSQNLTYISDLGQYRPANKQVRSHDDVSVYGILPYIAPEVLRGDEYTPASDTYSFGVVMWEVATERKPLYDRAHNTQLAWDICNGLRPSITIEMPKCYKELMERCWDANPSLRPSSRELEETLMSWGWHMGISQKHVVSDQFIAAEEKRLQLLESSDEKSLQRTDHPEAIYRSRLLYFPDLPKPRNASDSMISYSYDEDFTNEKQKNKEEAYYGEEPKDDNLVDDQIYNFHQYINWD